MEFYGFLEKIVKKAQVPGTYDVCDNCIYNNQNRCTFEGDPNMAQLPMGCPKRPDTQKVFEMARKMLGIKVSQEISEEEINHAYNYIRLLVKGINNIMAIFPEKIKSRYGLDEPSRKKMEEITKDCMNIAEQLSDLLSSDKELKAYALKVKDLLSTMSYPQIRYANNTIDELIYLLEQKKMNKESSLKSKKSSKKYDKEKKELADKVIALMDEDELFPFGPESYKDFELRFQMRDIVERYIDEVLNSESFSDKILEIWEENPKELVDFVLEQLPDKYWYGEFRGSKTFKNRKKQAQQFAPGPGPWEGSTTNEISQEVSRGTPERWDAGPFERISLTLARMGIQASQSEIAKIVNSWLEVGGKYTAAIKESQNPPQPPPNQPELNQNQQATNPPRQEGTKNCPRCGAQIPINSNICSNCGYNFQEGQVPANQVTAASYRLCYFCGKPVSKGMNFTLVLNQDEEIKGIAHLECAQTAAQQYQGNFDKNDDFVLVENAEKEDISLNDEEISPNDEVVLTEDFGEYEAGELGRVVSEPEVEEVGLSPIRVDDKLYVKFDKNPDKIEIVPREKLQKTSKIKKVAEWKSCPFNPNLNVLVVADHCVYATDDPQTGFCTNKECKYNRPVSFEEWKRLLNLEFPLSLPIFRKFY